MGMRVRLKASFDISGFPPRAQVILRALKKYGMMVADVAGHGFGPALLMAEVRAYLRALAWSQTDLGEILTSANRLLIEDVAAEHFQEGLQITPMKIVRRGVRWRQHGLRTDANVVRTIHRDYIDAGADGIMIHSRQKSPDEIFEFCERAERFPKQVPLVVVPTTYHQVAEAEFVNRGVSVVIYANHMLRAAYPQMLKVAQTILEHGRALEADQYLCSISDALSIIPENLQ